MNRLTAVLALGSVLCGAGVASAQCAQVCYYQPQTVYYAAAPAATSSCPQTSCYTPTTTYYAPATTYYAPTTAYYAPTTTYYAPATTAYYAPAPIVQTRYRPILGGTVSRVYYPSYYPAYPTIAYYRY